MSRKLKTPFRHVLPPLAEPELEALRVSIETHGGVHTAILVDEDDNILDGHHRYSLYPNAPIKVVRGLASEAEKIGFVLASGDDRREFTPDQRKRQHCTRCGGPLEAVHHERYPYFWGAERPEDLSGICKRCHYYETVNAS